jgi:hypothetical protein
MKKLFIVCTALCLMGFTTEQRGTITHDTSVSTQPYSERKAQDQLPQSHDPLWATFAKSKVTEDKNKGLYSMQFAPEVKKLVGTQITVTGFVLPLEDSEKFHHFLLSRRTPVCAFHPPGDPWEIMDVWSNKSIIWKDDLVKVTGTLSLMNNQQLGVFYKLSNAEVH